MPRAENRQSIVLDLLRTLRHGKTDAQIIGDAKHPGDDFIDIHETYSWYRAIGCAKAPITILEIGVRFGYAGIALICGAVWAGVKSPSYVGIDAETDGIVSNTIALNNIIDACPVSRNGASGGTAYIIKANTRYVAAVNAAIAGQLFDIVHVDGDHSIQGVQNELSIASAAINPTGWILIDDIDTPHIKDAADKFCKSHGIIPLHVPTFHGLYLCCQ